MKLGPNQTKFVEALESGEFKQGRDQLQLEDTLCCLGVGCAVAARNGVEVETESHVYAEVEITLSGEDLDDQPAVQNWLALRDSCGEPREEEFNKCLDYVRELSGPGPTAASLVALNDGWQIRRLDPLTHPQIAAVLRRFPSAYFSESK